MARLIAKTQAVVFRDRDDCVALSQISTDFQALIRSNCPLCNGAGSVCLAEDLQHGAKTSLEQVDDAVTGDWTDRRH